MSLRSTWNETALAGWVEALRNPPYATRILREATLEKYGNGYGRFFYFYERLPCGLDEVEDHLDQTLGSAGEVAGSSAGAKKSNVDLFIENKNFPRNKVVALVQNALSPLNLPDSARIVIDGEKYPIK